MDKPVAGQNWYGPEENAHWGSYCWSGPGARATLSIPIKRDRERLAVVAWHVFLIKKQLTGLYVEVDGIRVPHSVCMNVSPPCIVARVPARNVPSDSETELALVLPRTVSPSSQRGGSPDQRLLGLAVSSISVIPVEPALPIGSPVPRFGSFTRIMGLSRRNGAVHAFPLPYFDGLAYLEANPDVAEAVITGRIPSALEHYRRHGRKDGRRFALAVARAPNEGGMAELFDGLAYIEMYPDVADAVRSETQPSAFEHYLKYGRKEGRKIPTRLDGQVRRGTALDLVRLETARLARANMDVLKAQLGREIAAQSSQLGGQLAKIESVISGAAHKTDLESARAEFRKVEGGMDALREELGQISLRNHVIEEIAAALAREHALLGQIEEVKAGLADAQQQLAAVARVDEMEQVKTEIAKSLAWERNLFGQVDAIKSGLAEAQQRLAGVARADQLEQVRKEVAAESAARAARAEELERMKRDATRELERVRGEIANALTMREAREQAVLEQIELLRISLDESQRRLSATARAEDLDRHKRDATQDLERVRSEIASTSAVESARGQALLAQIDTLKAEINSAKTRAELAEVKVASAERELGAKAQQFAGSLSSLGDRLESAKTEVARLQSELDAVKNQAASTGARVNHPNLSAFNVLGFQAHPRMLLKNDAERLATHWAPLLGLSLQEKELYYLAHRVCSMESACTGRLAASVNDILLRILVARAIKSPRLAILEIGTLFGLGVGALHEALAPQFERVQFTVIDPLEGFYGAQNRDILTGVPVNRAVFEENLRRTGVSTDAVNLIQLLSTDPRALRRARKQRYDLIIIDADHTYNGVKNDAEKYVGSTKRGGYVIFDDYGNQHWPDVKKYVDAEVMPRKDLKFIGAEWHTAVFQVAAARAQIAPG